MCEEPKVPSLSTPDVYTACRLHVNWVSIMKSEPYEHIQGTKHPSSPVMSEKAGTALCPAQAALCWCWRVCYVLVSRLVTRAPSIA